MPPDGNKNTHGPVRAMFKRASLGTLYGMGARTMSEYVGVSELKARMLLHSHREIFWKFWRWSDAVYDAAISTRVLKTTFGWQMRVLPNVKSGTILNWPMQSNGAEMLRIACCLAVNRGIKIIAPIHVSTPEQKCIGWPEQKYINDAGKKAPELGAFRQVSGLGGMIRRRI